MRKLFWYDGPLARLAALVPLPADELLTDSNGPAFPAAAELSLKLLNVGGQSVVIPYTEEEFSEYLVANAAVFPSGPISILEGDDNSCHSNSSKVWKKDPLSTRLCTGYALSADGIWRRHSWVLKVDEIIETTNIRTSYFGVALDLGLSESFAAFHLDDE